MDSNGVNVTYDMANAKATLSIGSNMIHYDIEVGLASGGSPPQLASGVVSTRTQILNAENGWIFDSATNTYQYSWNDVPVSTFTVGLA
jgi:hypothetical protein